MEKSAVPSARRHARPHCPHAEPLIKQFVEHWGLMARAWGINSIDGGALRPAVYHRN